MICCSRAFNEFNLFEFALAMRSHTSFLPEFCQHLLECLDKNFVLCSFLSPFQQILHAVQEAEKAEKPPISELFTDVYDISPSNLREQEHSLRETIKEHPQDYPSNVPI